MRADAARGRSPSRGCPRMSRSTSSTCATCPLGHGAFTAFANEERRASMYRRQEARSENVIPEVHMDSSFMERKVRLRAAYIGAQGRGHKDDCGLPGAEEGRGQRLRDQEILAVYPGFGYHGSKVAIQSDKDSPVRAVAEKLAKERSEPQTMVHSPARSPGRTESWSAPTRKWSTRCAP